MKSPLRRNFLKSVLAGMFMLAAGIRVRLAGAGQDQLPVFLHGIASGDPTPDSIILWTRVSVVDARSVKVHWQLAEDVQMTRIVANGSTVTDSSKDFTVKVDADGLPGGATLFYQFRVGDRLSLIGRTRTLPSGDVESAKFAVVSCSNYPNGFFNVYRDIAARSDLDAVLHLGDYIYEYGVNEYGSKHAEALGRVSNPAHELHTLQDYRLRHAQYKSDTDSQAMLASLPLIAVWDDHELANDAWHRGAEAHSKDEGSWGRRRDAAIQAYFEWMPIRGKPRGRWTRIFREFRYGNLASLLMLDTRFHGRDPQPYIGKDVTKESVDAALKDRKRRMLGSTQERWLRRSLKRAADTKWQVLGQQVLMSKMTSPNLEPIVDVEKPSDISKDRLQGIVDRSKNNPPSVLDTWDGYPMAREDLYADLGNYASNPVILSGDLHTSLAAELIPKHADRPVAVEFMVGAVSSPVMSDILPEKKPNALRDGVLEQNPRLKYLDTIHRGWLCVTLTQDECVGEWYLIDTIKSRDFRSWRDRSLSVRAGKVGEGLQD